ncbi:UBP1-associated protein 2B, partial [Mucuna pruriens]
MARKRKQPPQPARSEEPPLKQQQQSQFDAEAEYEEVEEEHKEEEEESEEEEEDDEEEEANDETPKLPSTSSSSPDGVDDEPIQNLLEPLGKDEIARLLCEAASKHRDVADRIRRAADVDPSHRKIFVHGLGWDATAETLTAAFRQYGEIEDCKAVADKATGKSKGYGFILFKTRRGARNALREPQKRIGNRTAACQLASVGPVQPQAAAIPASTTPGASEFTQKIYVSNVGAELDPQRLLAFFSRFGEIEEGPLGLDKVTGKPKGFCLFVYKSVEGAKRALEVPHKKFEGHILHCQRAIDGPKQQRMMAVPGSSQSGGFVGGVAAVPAPGHLMAPAGPATAVQPVNPAIGQALTALLASRGAGLQLNGLLGIGSPAAVAVNPGGYGGQGSVNPGGVGVSVGGYGNQVGLQGAYASQQQVGIGGSGRGQQQQQYGVGQYGGVAPYMDTVPPSHWTQEVEGFHLSASIFYYWPGKMPYSFSGLIVHYSNMLLIPTNTPPPPTHKDSPCPHGENEERHAVE